MADDSGNEDQWLYGDSNQEAVENGSKEEENNDNAPEAPPGEEPVIESREEENPIPADREEGQLSAEEEQPEQTTQQENENEEEDDDSDDDDVHVTIGDIKTSPTYTTLNLKRGPLPSAAGGDKAKYNSLSLQQPGKFSIEEFEAVGTINGVQAHDFNLDSLEDKPWRKPGADITDYFNYGFNEETWRAYCERQKRMRIHESGVGLGQIGGPGKGNIPVAIVNDNSKYSGSMGPKKAGPPPGRKLAGSIDVIGGTSLASRRSLDKPAATAKENVIEVMTADRREYSRKPFPDMSVPPPGLPPFDIPPPHNLIPPITTFSSHHGTTPYGAGEFYTPEADPYYHSYEPTQDSQWMNQNLGTKKADRMKRGELARRGGAIDSKKRTETTSYYYQSWDSASGAEMGHPPPPIGMGGPAPTALVVPLPLANSSSTGVSSPIRSSSKDRKEEPGLVSQDSSQDAFGGSVKGSGSVSGRGDPDDERIKDDMVVAPPPPPPKEKEGRHRDRSHRHRSRSRSTERRRRHKSRSRSPGHRHRKKKSRREREVKEESE
ncbi:pre-mRNA 3'-end-processing factor FIP1 isoform X2 [Ischnura elegans]|uniref:pre-mRNA 3'-end-processing factor FIP1 isoform X2 n=1 Tax=Ischnura elegans TaxID=197161 RepID=UPI001ED8942F|nr:pre-mRNA 3'-end-processing factor FIP1 isoform X2 [Ischnura elegans]